MYIELQNLNLYTGIREEDYKIGKLHLNDGWIKMGNCNIRKNGDSILTQECNFKLQVEQNLQTDISHNGKSTEVFSIHNNFLFKHSS